MAESLSAQTSGSGLSIPTVLLWVLAAVIVLAALFMGESILKLEANNSGADKKRNYSLFPNRFDFFGSKIKPGVPTGNLHVLSKGHDIKLEGGAERVLLDFTSKGSTYAIKPTDFHGIAPIPKVQVEVGDNVLAGDALFYDKANPNVKFCSPVSGEVIAINRGAKRAITEVVVLADKEINYRSVNKVDLSSIDQESLLTFLQENGVFPLIKRRPFQLVANPAETPRDIFVSTFDTAPLAPDTDMVLNGRTTAFHKGLEVLSKLTSGKVHLGIDAMSNQLDAINNAPFSEKHWFAGKHPAGNVGVQIHHIAPISMNDVVWTLGVQEVITIGALFTEGRYNAERVVAITGAEFNKNHYVKTYQGACLSDLIKENVSEEVENVRFVSGDVLTGSEIAANGYLGFYDDQITVLKEGNYNEMFGWLLPLAPRPSISRTFPGFLMPNYEYTADTNTHGERRAFVVTGQYEQVLPMDIYPQHLMKAILTNDYERMEGLGLAELVEEDVALCEFVCTSKQPLQQILREGLDMMHEQM